MLETTRLIDCMMLAWKDSPFKGKGLQDIMKKIHNAVYNTPERKATYKALNSYFYGKLMPAPPLMKVDECQTLLQEMEIIK